MAFTDRSTSARPKGVETYRTASGRFMVEPPRGSNLKNGEVKDAVKSAKQRRSGDVGKTAR